MADKITNDITLLFKTKLDDKSKQEVGKNLKGLLENAVIDFDEAEIKKNLVPIINMIRVLFEKADMKFDADKLLQMPSRQALQKVADMSAQEFQNAFEKALAKNGGLSLGFDDIDTSAITTSLNNLTKEVSKISKQVTNTTKKSVHEIERSIKALDKLPKKDVVRKAATADSIEDTLVDYSSDKKLSSSKAITALDHARQAYEKSVTEKNPWVVQYKYLLDFVSKYEKLNHKTMERVEKEMPEFRNLYDRLAPHAGNVRESLEDYVVTIKGGGELSQYKNQPWGRETTLKEIRDTLKNGISVKDVDANKEGVVRDSVKHTPPASDVESNNIPVASEKKVEDVVENINTENLANKIVDAVVEPVLTDLEKQIIAAVEEAKTKTSRKWDNVSHSDQEKWISEALESRLTISPFIDDDSMDEILFDAVGYSNGVGEISDISDAISKWVVSIEDEFNKADDEVKELVRSFAKIDDETSDEAWQISEQIADRNELLNELIIQDKNDSWSKFKDKLLGKTTSRSELLPTMEGIEKGAMEPSDEQKEYVLKLGEEYRSIVSILENSDNEFTDALKERASAIKEIMHAINIQDGFLDQTYTGTYGGDSKTASVLMNWRKEDELFLDRYDSSKIDDGARQTVIDLIHQETEARKQSIEVKREENIVDQQQNIDALKSKYESAAEQEKALVQDVINIRKEERSLEQFDDDASEEALDKLMSERLNKTKALREINKDLWDAITSVGRDEIEKHINTIPVASEVASTVDTTVSKEQFSELKQSVDNVAASVGVKTQAFQGEETAVKNVVENEQKQLGDLKDSVEAVTSAIKTKTQEFLNEQSVVKRVAQSEINAMSNVEKKVTAIKVALNNVNTLLKNVKSGINIASGLSNITINVNHQNNDEESRAISIDQESLRHTLSDVVYNVKIAHDDADKQANKIARDEAALESTLKRVFTGVLNPKVKENVKTPKKEPWALENTLNGEIKQLLVNIQNNTAKINQKPQTAENDVDSTLGIISKNVLEINSKIIKGTKAPAVDKKEPIERLTPTAIAKEVNKRYKEFGVLMERAGASNGALAEQLYSEAEATLRKIEDLEKLLPKTPKITKMLNESMEAGAEQESNRQYRNTAKSYDASEVTKLRDILNLEKEISKFRADIDTENNSGVQHALEEEIAIRTDLIEKIRQGKEIDVEAEAYRQRVTANNTKQAKAEAKQRIKDIEATFKEDAAVRKQIGKRQAMTGKAGSAIGRAENVWMEAESLDATKLPKEFLDNVKTHYKALDELRLKQIEVSNADEISEEQKSDLIEQTRNVNKLTEEIGGLVSEYQRLSGSNVDESKSRLTTLTNDSSLDEYRNQMSQYVREITHGKGQVKSFNNETRTLTYTVKTGKNEFTEYTVAVRGLDHQMVSVAGSTKRAETFFEATMRKMKEISSYMSGMSILSRTWQELRRGIQYVKEIDDALTELKKVTDETEETYEKFLDTAGKTADKVGSTVKEIVNSTADWARLGYSIQEATNLAESTSVLLNVSEFESIDSATSALVSTMQAFNYAAEDSMHIVDVMNEIGNNYSVSSDGIATALQESASALVTANNSYQEAVAMIAAANKTTQDVSKVGGALRTVSLRLRGTEVEGEDNEGLITSMSKLREKIQGLSGVDILTDTGAYKSTYQILLEISKVFSTMNDMDQAALLEIIAGKNRSNVVAGLLANTEDLESALLSANEAQNSALRENEKYLDSIQGKIDLFNNSVQTMWNNALDGDVVKGFVSLGTEIIKIIDKIGLLNTVLVTLATYSMIKHKMGPITFFKELVGLIPKGVKGLQTWIQSMQSSDAATVASIKTKVADTAATTANTAANTANAASSVASGVAEDKDTADTIENTAATVADTAATAANTAANTANASSSVVGGAATGTAGAGAATGAVGASFTGLAAAVPYILGAVAAIAAIVIVFKLVTKDINELKEELQESQSEFDNTKSEIESINSELETTQERIAELLAKPSLSFVEQEELKKLQQQNALLERNLKLQEMILSQKEAELVADTQAYLSAEWDGSNWYDKPYAVNGATGIISEDKWYTRGVGSKDALDVAIDKYAKTKQTSDALAALAIEWDDNSSDGNAKLISSLGLDNLIYAGADDKSYVLEQQKAYDAALVQIASGISSVIDNPQYSGLSYGMSSEIDAFLDEWNAYQYKFQEAQGLGGKSSAIASVFDDTSSDSIKKLKEDLSEIAGDDTLDAAKKQKNALDLVNEAVDSTSGEYDRLKTSMDIIGIKADEVARYFVQLSEASDSSSVEGITSQYQKGVEAFGKYKGAATDIISEFTDLDGTVEQITWGSLFDNDGEAIDTQISKVLQGASETTRAEFARIAKSVNEGTMSIETAMSSFSGSGLVAVSKLIEESFGELNKSVFKGLEDEISGFIDTFSEFSAALEDVASSMDLLHTAQEQYNNSGQVSVKTALELMQSTDQWNKILTVENGKITLNAEAQDVLVQSKLNTVEANLAEAKASIQNQLAQLGAADATLLSAEASDITAEAYTIYTNAMNSYTASIAGFGAALDALVNGRIFGDDGIMGSFQSAYNATKEVKTYENTTNISALREKLAEVDQMEDFFEGVNTFDEFANNYDFDKTPGDKYGNDEDSKTEEKMDAFQREMDYWENRIAANRAKYGQLQNEIDRLESRGQKAGAAYYEEQIKLEGQRLQLLRQQKAAAQKYLDQIIASGNEGSEEFWEVANTLNDIEDELDDVTASIVDLQDAIGDIETYKFEEFNTRLDNLASKLGTIRDLIAPDGESDWFDEEGGWTEKGVAALGTYVQELEFFKQGYQDTVDEIAKYQSEYAGNEDYYETLGIHSEQELYDKQQDLIDQQYDYAESISNSEQSIVDMYESSIDATEEYTETLIDSYNDYIDSVKEALSAERDLYDFKKKVKNESKNIAELERKIASLSGSTNKSDIASRRKLEEELYSARESLNDTYYDHAKQSQQDALDSEAQAYEDTMTKMVEGMRTSLEQATLDMDTFLGNVTTMVTLNAGAILTEYQNTGVELDPALTTPWVNAKNAVGSYSGDALDLMNQWTQGGFFTTFPNAVGKSLSSPWGVGTNAVNAFKSSVDTAMSDVVKQIESNISTARGSLDSLYKQIQETEKRAAEVKVIVPNPNSTPPPSPQPAPKPAPKPEIKLRGLMQTSKEMILGSKGFVDENTETINGVKYYRDSKTGYYYKISDLNSNRKYDGGRTTGWAIPKGTWFYTKHAKGTTGVTEDHWAITDEPQFGDELVLVPGKDGNLSFMRKGTGVVPADLTQKLFELAQIPTSDLMNKNLTAIVPNITKNDFKNEFNFESLVHVDTVDSDTLPKLEKMVDKKIDDFSRALNYSLKKFAR